ncbi:MAG: hypothetical protein ACF788_01835 [Novipirellula sp. JB048]
MKTVPFALAMLAFFALVVAALESPAYASEPGWSPVVIATGAYRDKIRSMPIEQRPYRPGHFYGNTIRRMHHRGEILPRPLNFPAPQGVFGAANPIAAPAASDSRRSATGIRPVLRSGRFGS